MKNLEERDTLINLVPGQIMGRIKQQHFGFGFAGDGFSDLGTGQFFIKNIFDLVLLYLFHQLDQIIGCGFGIRRDSLGGQIFQAVALGQITESIVAAIDDFLVSCRQQGWFCISVSNSVSLLL